MQVYYEVEDGQVLTMVTSIHSVAGEMVSAFGTRVLRKELYSDGTLCDVYPYTPDGVANTTVKRAFPRSRTLVDILEEDKHGSKGKPFRIVVRQPQGSESVSLLLLFSCFSLY